MIWMGVPTTSAGGSSWFSFLDPLVNLISDPVSTVSGWGSSAWNWLSAPSSPTVPGPNAGTTGAPPAGAFAGRTARNAALGTLLTAAAGAGLANHNGFGANLFPGFDPRASNFGSSWASSPFSAAPLANSPLNIPFLDANNRPQGVTQVRGVNGTMWRGQRVDGANTTAIQQNGGNVAWVAQGTYNVNNPNFTGNVFTGVVGEMQGGGHYTAGVSGYNQDRSTRFWNDLWTYDAGGNVTNRWDPESGRFLTNAIQQGSGGMQWTSTPTTFTPDRPVQTSDSGTPPTAPVPTTGTPPT